MPSHSPVSDAFGASRRRDLVAQAAQVVARPLGGYAALRRAVEEAELEQVRLVDVLDRLDLFADHRGDGRAADRAGRELLDDGREEAAVGGVEALVVDVHRVHRRLASRGADAAVASDLGVVAHAAQQAVDDARRAPPPPRDDVDRLRLDVARSGCRRSADDRRPARPWVVVEPIDGAEAVAQRRR